MVTVTPGRTPPEESTTRPPTLPRDSCAALDIGAAKPKTAVKTRGAIHVVCLHMTDSWKQISVVVQNADAMPVRPREAVAARRNCGSPLRRSSRPAAYSKGRGILVHRVPNLQTAVTGAASATRRGT